MFFEYVYKESEILPLSIGVLTVEGIHEQLGLLLSFFLYKSG